MITGIIGCGSLGTAILKSLKKFHPETNFIVSTKCQTQYNELIKHENFVTQSNWEIAQTAKNIFLCVKPADAKDVCHDIQRYISEDSVVISAMAGVPFIKLQDWLQHKNVVKIMPTMSVPSGPVTVYNPLGLTFEKFSENFISVNHEDIVDISTAVSGCMPGFLANVFQQWIIAAENLGMERSLAEKLICRNAAAFGDLRANNLQDLQRIQSQVASKGGATEKGLMYMDDSRLSEFLGFTMGIANDRVLEFASNLRTGDE